MFVEPQSGFRIAFNMFDTDGNQRVDKNEFLVVSTYRYISSLALLPKLFQIKKEYFEILRFVHCWRVKKEKQTKA